VTLLALHDWPFATAAVVLAAGGVVLLGWSLWWDRPRGRKRCPKCWYDMSGAAGLVCPECGKDARRERRLLKTRRRWGWATLAVVLLLAAYPVRQVPIVRRDGWWAAAPTWAVILAVPYLEHRGELRRSTRWRDPLYSEIRARLIGHGAEPPRLTRLERWLLDGASRRALGRRTEESKKLGARLFVLARPDSVERAPAGREAYVVLAASARAYATCRTYRHTATTAHGSTTVRSLVAMERDTGFRGELRRTGTDWHHVVWANSDVTWVWNAARGRVEFTASLSTGVTDLANQSPPGVSSVTAMLFPWQGSSVWALNELDHATLVGSEVIDGHACDAIHGVGGSGEAIDVLIDRETLLVRRVTVGGRSAASTDLEPEMGVEIDPAWFEFNPSRPDETPLTRE
jgi:hypothetical protein